MYSLQLYICPAYHQSWPRLLCGEPISKAVRIMIDCRLSIWCASRETTLCVFYAGVAHVRFSRLWLLPRPPPLLPCQFVLYLLYAV